MVTLRTFLALVGLCLPLQFVWANPTDFTVRGVDGTNVFKLSDAKGKFVALHFLLQTECPYCLKHTRDYAEKSAGDPQVVQIFLKPDGDEEIKLWAAKLGDDSLKLTIYRDPEAALAKAFNITDGYKFHGQVVHYPALIILDGGGKEVFRYIGKSNADRFSYEKFSAKLKELTGTSPR
jgi:peroxiredoxin Q/BCP